MLTWRALGEDDLSAAAAVCQAMDLSDGNRFRTDEAGLRERIVQDRLDLAESSIGAFDGGRLLAFGVIGAALPRGARRFVVLRGGVHPEHRRRGIGASLLDWQIERAGALHDALDVRLNVMALNDPPGNAVLLGQRGFVRERDFTEMTATLPAPRLDITVPSGLTLLDLTGAPPELDEATRVALNEAFADHWDAPVISAREWRGSFTGSASFLPGCSAVLRADDGRVASFVLGYAEQDGDLGVGDVGTVRAWRGRGLASLLTSHVLAAADRQGLRTSTLSVDAANPTGALRVYRRCGYVATSGYAAYLRPIRPPVE